MKKYLPYLNILGAAACWGCIGLFNRFLMRAGMGAANIVVIRNFGGLVLLTLIFALRERSVFHVKAKHLPIFFGTGVVSMVFFTLCYFKCQELCSLAVSAILLYTAPAMVVRLEGQGGRGDEGLQGGLYRLRQVRKGLCVRRDQGGEQPGLHRSVEVQTVP